MSEQRTDKVERVSPNDMPPLPKSGLGGMLSGTKGLIIVMFLIAALISFVLDSYYAMPKMSKVDDAAVTKITELTSQLETLKETNAKLTSQVAAFQTQVTKDIATQTQTIDAKLTNINVTGYVKTVDLDQILTTYAKKSTLEGLDSVYIKPGDVDAALKGYVTTAKLTEMLKGYTQSDLTDVLKNYALQSKVDTLNTQVANLNSRLLILEAGTTTTSGGTTSSSTVYATVVGNTFTGSKILGFTAMAINETQSQTFNFTITNGAGKTINNIQLALALGLLTPSNVQYPSAQGLPVGTTISITLNGFMTTFSQQSTGTNNTIGFTNVVSTGIFSGMGAINQTAGTSTYTVTITINSGSTNAVPAFNIFPNVLVASYS